MARLIRVALVVAPVIVGWLAVRATKQWFWQPDGWPGLALWILQAIAVAGLASLLASRIADRFAPLSALFQMTLVFPDHAPSRYGVALRQGTVAKMSDMTALSSTSVQDAAEQAVAMVSNLGTHERLTRGHTERVRAHAELIGTEMGLGSKDLELLRWGVLLHDIGKLRVPAEILNKKGKLTSEEWAILQQHPAEGARIVAPLAGWLGEWVEAAGQHHERWDGTGYPARLSGTDISLAGRITAVADAFDVITSKRSYKEAMSPEAARKELVRSAGTQFDPDVVRAALTIGLREPQRLGLMSWLAELPAVARLLSAVPSAVGAATVAVAVSLGGAASQVVPPETIAMADAEAPTFETETTLVPTTMVTPLSTSPTSVPTTASPAPTSTQASVATGPLPFIPFIVGPSTNAPPATATTAIAPASTTTSVLATTAPTATAAPTTTAPTTAPTTTAPTTAPTSSTTTSQTSPIPIDAGGTPIRVLLGADIPTDVSEGALESDTVTFIFPEQQQVALTADLIVRAWTDGTNMNANDSTSTVIPAGTVVCSWFVHHDPVGHGNWTPSIDFGDTTMLGQTITRADLQATDALRRDGVTYTYGNLGGGDQRTIEGTMISLDFADGPAGQDQMRILTSC